MTTLANDTFIRANQSGWGTASDGLNTWSLVRGTTTLAISSNTGTDVGNSGSFAVVRCGTGTSADTEQVVTFKRGTNADLAGLVSRYTDNSNWYNINIGEFANNLVFAKMVAGVYTDVAFGPSVTPTLADKYSIRFRNVGTGIQARMWDATGAEPGTWDINTTDASLSGAHGFGVVTDPDPGGGTTIVYSSYNATDGSTGGTTTRSLPVRLLLSVQRIQSVPLRLRLSVQRTLSLPLRTRLSIRATRSVPIRLLLRITKTISLPMRTRLSVLTTRSLPVRLLLRILKTVSVPIRTRLSVLHTLSLPMRLLLRTLKTVSVPIRTRLSILHTISLPIRLRLSRLANKSLPVRLKLLAAVTKSLPIRLNLALPTPLATTFITAQFRSSQTRALFRDGESQATFRSGQIEEEAR